MQKQKSFTGSRTILLPAVILLAASLLFSACGKEEVAEEVEVVRPVKILTVQSGQTASAISLPGRVRAAKRSELSFKVSGPLVALPIEEGQEVKKGDLIAQIQQRDFQTALDEAKARNLEAEKQFRRYKELYAKKQVSRADYDRYRAARDVAKAQLEDAHNRLLDTSLKAPFDGVISKRFVENFQKVQAKEAIANLQDTTRIEILVDVPELLMASMKKVEDELIIYSRFESIPGKEYALALKEYSTQADPNTQTYRVVLIMDQPEEAKILPGMTATVTSETTSGINLSQQTIVIPAIAVLEGAGHEPYIWLFDKETSTAHKTSVRIGPLRGTADISIEEGVSDGDTIIITGITQLEEGMKVRPWEQQREGK